MQTTVIEFHLTPHVRSRATAEHRDSVILRLSLAASTALQCVHAAYKCSAAAAVAVNESKLNQQHEKMSAIIFIGAAASSKNK